MWCKTSSILTSFIVIAISANFCLAACPSADLTGDCFVDFNDFAVMANQWLTGDPCVPDDMVRIPGGTFEMGDSFNEGDSDELPVHTVTVDSFYMGKYEITNEQYCAFLNDANSLGEIKVVSGTVYASFDGSNSYPYCDTSTANEYSQIAYSGGVFSVRTKSGRDMSDDPMVEVSWYGAAAYCNWRSEEEGYETCYDPCDPNWPCDFSEKGYRLATEAEWEYAARGGFSGRRFPWGDTVTHSQVNYYSSSSHFYDISPTRGYHPTWNDGVYPYTAPVGSFSANGYGLYGMAGNVWQWCNDWYDSDYYDYSPTINPIGPISGTYRVLRGGAWISHAYNSRVAHRARYTLSYCGYYVGFRIVLPVRGDASADLTGDCFVDHQDLALMANQWLTTDPCIPDDMLRIPGGTFEMGDNFNEGYSVELPVHTVTLDSFYMGKYEITNRQYCDYLNSAYDANDIKIEGGIVYASSDDSNSYPYCDTKSYNTNSQIDYNDVSETFNVRTKSRRDMSNDPMVQVSWYGAAAYCNWRSQEDGEEQCYNSSTWDCDFGKHGYRLATEAEWEYAARGGLSGRRFAWGNTISHNQANYKADPLSYTYDVNPTEGFHPTWNDGVEPYTSPVGSFSANGYGLYDMAGNAWEWCNDWWDLDYYDYTPTNNPTGPAAGSFRVLRGGGWYRYAFYCRVTFRTLDWPDYRSNYNGFRIVLDLKGLNHDSEPPNILGLDFHPKTVDVSNSPGTITFTFRAADDLSGVEFVNWCIWSPSGQQGYCETIYGSSRISGDALDGIYQYILYIPQYTEQGTWHLKHLGLSDNVGNGVSFTESELAGLGFPTEIQIISVSDLEPPQVLELDFNPKTVNTAESPETVTFTFRAADDLSGVQFINWCIWSPLGQQGYCETIYGSSRISGDALDGIYQGTVVIPQYSEQGTWHLKHLGLGDDVGNQVGFTEAELAGLGFPTELESTAE